MLFVNFKTYPESSGEKAVFLAQICAKVSFKVKIPIIPCVQALDLDRIVRLVKIPVWVQHLDPVSGGKNTGYLTAQAVKEHGGRGTLLNHSEHPLSYEQISLLIKIAKKEKLKTLVLVDNATLAKKIDSLSPDYIAIEEPRLIGGKTPMASLKYGEEKIKKFIAVIKKSIPLVGAGINKNEDVERSLRLGAKGVLVSSAIVKSLDPEKSLNHIIKGFH